MKRPKVSSDRGQPVLIASISARALVQAARRSGFKPFAVDFFADEDLQEAAEDWGKMPGPLAQGFDAEVLLGSLDELASNAGEDLAGVVAGSGFEDRPQLLRAIEQRWGLIGNEADIVTRVKDPENFFVTLSELGLAFPDFQFVAPTSPDGWLFKKIGGAGGGHIAEAADRNSELQGYYQEFVAGEPVSALVLGDGRNAVVLGLSEQWTAPTPSSKMRYGGAVRPAGVTVDIARRLEAAACDIAGAFGLKGLNSVDFIVQREDFVVLEVNARPGATLDLYDGDDCPLFAWHVAACGGRLVDEVPGYSSTRASMVVYADETFNMPEGMRWPDWTADRPPPGELIVKDLPLCTVIGEGDGPGVTKKLVRQYSHQISDAIGRLHDIQ